MLTNDGHFKYEMRQVYSKRLAPLSSFLKGMRIHSKSIAKVLSTGKKSLIYNFRQTNFI